MRNWIIVKLFIHYLRKVNKAQEIGLEIDKILDEAFGQKKSERVQDEIIGIMEKIIRQLKSDRKK